MFVTAVSTTIRPTTFLFYTSMKCVLLITPKNVNRTKSAFKFLLCKHQRWQTQPISNYSNNIHRVTTDVISPFHINANCFAAIIRGKAKKCFDAL